MRKPKIYNSELLLENFIEKNDTKSLIRYIRSMNQYIDYIERHIEKEDIEVTLEGGEEDASNSEY